MKRRRRLARSRRRTWFYRYLSSPRAPALSGSTPLLPGDTDARRRAPLSAQVALTIVVGVSLAVLLVTA